MNEMPHEFSFHWFFTPTSIEKSIGLWPIRSGTNRAKPNFKVGPRVINYYSLHFVLKGEGTIHQGDTVKHLKAGDVFGLFHSQTHQFYTDPGNTLELFWLAFDGKQSLSLLNRVGMTPEHYVFEDFINEEIRAEIDGMAAHFSQEMPDDELVRAGLILRLFHQLTVQARARNLAPGTPVSWLQKSKQYMDMHFAENVTVADVAKYIGVHRSYFATSFVKEYGITPVQYLFELKMKRAAQLIAERSHTITEISYSLGYPDLYSFSRAFKKYYGASPRNLSNSQ